MNSGSSTSLACGNNKKDRHIFYNFNFNIPASATISGIEVNLEAKADGTAGTPRFCVELSWDGGSSWTVAKTTPTLGAADTLFTLGTSADQWNRTWAGSEFGNSGFRVRITSIASDTNRDFYLDWLSVNVTYRP